MMKIVSMELSISTIMEILKAKMITLVRALMLDLAKVLIIQPQRDPLRKLTVSKKATRKYTETVHKVEISSMKSKIK